jgi:inhibitor of cysteine peptidase
MPEVNISEAQAGSTIQVSTGDELVVSLRENPTTGFRWAAEAGSEAILVLKGSVFAAGAGGGLGAGGLRVMRFQAKAAGQTSLRLLLRQQWQPDDVAERFEIHVNVAR